jgi:NAD-dependent dihydropyrimidine dehydrogenase PreA subunit
VVYIITEPCVGSKSAACVAVCPVDCIYEGDEQYFINADECIGCGACAPECPVDAIVRSDELPAELSAAVAKARAFFGPPAETV